MSVVDDQGLETTEDPLAPRPPFFTVTPEIRRVHLDRPWVWLAAGWADLRKAPAVSLAYGGVFALIGAILTVLVVQWEVFYLVFPLMAGFFLVGPIAAVGLYDASRRLAAGESADFRTVFGAFSVNATQIALMGVVLLLINIAWVRLATMIFFMFFSDNPPPPQVFPFLAAVLSVEALPFLIVGNLLGGFMAAGTFAVAAMAIPVLLDRPKTHVIEAIAVSWQATTANVPTMALWAVLIVVFVMAGYVALFIGLAVTLPLIGHATWAAYKDTVRWPDAETAEPATAAEATAA